MSEQNTDFQPTHIVTQEAIDWLLNNHEQDGWVIANGVHDPHLTERVKVGQPVQIDYFGREFATMWVDRLYGYSIPNSLIPDMKTIEQVEVEEVGLPTWAFTDFGFVTLWNIGPQILALTTDGLQKRSFGNWSEAEKAVANEKIQTLTLSKPVSSIDDVPELTRQNRCIVLTRLANGQL